MNRDPDERPQPDGAVPDEFDAIVALWRSEGDVPQWPDEKDGNPDARESRRTLTFVQVVRRRRPDIRPADRAVRSRLED